jgi:hypothetical protein
VRRKRREQAEWLPAEGVLGDLNRVFGLHRLRRHQAFGAERLSNWNRTTAWRRVKEIRVWGANISGGPVLPKGLLAIIYSFISVPYAT